MSVTKGQYDLNKTLPLPPNIPEFPVKTDRSEEGSTSTKPGLAYPRESSISPKRASTASTFYSNNTHSTSSSRARVRFITRDMVDPQSLKAFLDSPTDLQRPDSVEPIKFDPTMTSDVSAASSRCKGLSYASDVEIPFSKLGQFPRASPGIQEDEQVSPKPSETSPRIPQSRSEGCVDPQYERYDNRIAKYHIPSYLLDKGSSGRQDKRIQSPENAERGRSGWNVAADEDLSPDQDSELTSEWPVPTRKRSRSPHKILFGESGWFGRHKSLKETAANVQQREESHEISKKTGLKTWGEKVKQRFEDPASPKKSPKPRTDSKNNLEREYQSTFPVSIHSSDQMTIYGELELLIVTQVNWFLMAQHRKGNVSAGSVSKVVNFWKMKNRPQVLEFMFDQITQRDLILYNLNSLQFAEEYQHNNVKLNSTLNQWRAIAKEMNVRTFCNPDSLIKQHVIVTHKVCEMINAHKMAFEALQEIAEKMKAKIAEAETKRQERRSKFGTPKNIDIPSSASPTRSSRYLAGDDDAIWEDIAED